jgi:hypothetical protein
MMGAERLRRYATGDGVDNEPSHAPNLPTHSPNHRCHEHRRPFRPGGGGLGGGCGVCLATRVIKNTAQQNPVKQTIKTIF